MDLEQRIIRLERDLAALNDETYKNNYSTYQEFNKGSNFTSALKLPHVTTLPAVPEAGYVCELDGKLYISTSLNTWALAGSQS